MDSIGYVTNCKLCKERETPTLRRALPAMFAATYGPLSPTTCPSSHMGMTEVLLDRSNSEKGASRRLRRQHRRPKTRLLKRRPCSALTTLEPWHRS